MKKQVCFWVATICIIVSLNAIPLRIFHTNDTHGAYLPRVVKTEQGTIMKGGYANLEYHLYLERSKVPRSIYVDAGDQQTGSIFASLNYHDAIGGAVIGVFNYLHLDASTFGNHEFDQSQENTLKLTRLADYPFVTTNLTLNDGTAFSGHPCRIITRDSLRIGIMGLTMLDLNEKVKRENIEGINVQSYKQSIDKYLDAVDAESDLIIILSHIGLEADSLLATILDNRVDLIIGGHSHDLVTEPYMVNGIYITSAGSYLNALGMIDLEVENDRITAFKPQLLDLVQPVSLPETPLNAFVKSIGDSLETEMGKVIASIPSTWTPDKFQETELSKWAANSLYADYQEQYHPDLAIINCGGLRKTIPAGPVTLRDMHELMPFSNYVVIFSCTGQDLLTMDMLNKQIAREKPYDIVQTANAGWGMGSWGGDLPFKNTYLIGKKPLNPNKVYRVVSHDYILGQWDKYLGFKPFDVIETGDLILDSAIRQIKIQYPLR